MLKKPDNNEGIERVTLKLPKRVAEYFRKTFPHGKRSDFVAACIMHFKKEQEIAVLEDELRDIGKERNV